MPLQSAAVAHFFAQTPEPFSSTHVAPSTQSAVVAHAPPTAVLLPQATKKPNPIVAAPRAFATFMNGA